MVGKSVSPPNYTQAPNFFFDQIMPRITATSELKVTLAIIRQTFGYHKEYDKLSLSRLEDLTGLSRKSVAEGVKLALGRGYVGRRKDGDSYIYGLRIGSEESTPPPAGTSEESTPVASEESTPTKENDKRNYEAKASGLKPKEPTVIPLDRYTTERMYDAYKQGGFPRWTREEFGYHLGRVQQIIKEDSPTEEEMHKLPAFFIEYYTDWNPKADAVSTLREMRRRAAREERETQRVSNVTPLRPVEPSRPKKRVIS
jgi:phage replication O-like protein O